MGNSNSNFSAGKNKEMLDKLKNLLAESESNPEIMAGCNDLFSKLKTLVEESESNTGGRSMSNDFKVNAVSGDSENLPGPEIIAAEIDIVAVGVPSRAAFETTEKKPTEPSMMNKMDEMFGGSIMDGIKSLFGAANNTEYANESNEMNTEVNNLKQLLEETEENFMAGGAIDNITIQHFQNLLAVTEQNVMSGGAIDDVTVQHFQNLLAETEQNVMSGGQVEESVNNLRNLLVQSESNFNYQSVNLRGGQVESENLFSSENQPLEEEETENENLDVSGGSEQSGGEELSSELVEILKSLKKENKDKKENKVGGSRKGDSERKYEDEKIQEEMESDFQGNTTGKWEEFQDYYNEHVGKSRKPKSKHDVYREWEAETQFGGKRRTSKKSSRKSSRKSSKKSRRMSKDSDYDLDDDMDMDTDDDEDYLSTSSLNTSDINIRHYR